MALRGERDILERKIHAAVKLHFPVGKLVRVRLGRAIVTGEIQGATCDYTFSPKVRIKNVDTGKERHFNPNYDEFEFEPEGKEAQ